jgi:hypothetical protein
MCHQELPRACAATYVDLFDYFVSASEQCSWRRKPERLCGLEIDHPIVLGRRLHRQVRSFSRFRIRSM